ncbi:MAG: hypothetical protein ACFCBW_21970 [Candidatus Competibacterales bacterium]
MSQAIPPAAPTLSVGLASVDLERWPIHAPDSEAYGACVAHGRAGLRAEGCAHLAAFIRPEARAALEAEVAAIADKAHFSRGRITPYFNDDEPELPSEHPRRRFADFSNGFVAMDWFPGDGICLSLYRDPAFMGFVQDCLEEPALYTFDDPLAGVVANIMPQGSALPWHYDTNEFIVSLLTRKPQGGGAFEYCPDLRAPGDERYPAVQGVLDGDRGPVRRLELELGDLQLFRGRFSLHRVCQGIGERHTAIFGYAKEPGFVGRVARTQQVHGRVTQVHIDAEQRARRDGLDD